MVLFLGFTLFAIVCSKGSTATVTTLQTAMYIDEVRNVIIKATNAGPDDDIIFLPPSSYMATPSLYFVTEICERLYVNEPVVFASEQTDEAELRSIHLKTICSLPFPLTHMHSIY